MVQAKLASVEEVRHGGVFKYVRMADDSLRFVEVTAWTPDHAQMIDVDEVARSAGSVAVDPLKSYVRTIFHGSMSLKLPSLPDDEDLIKRHLFPEATS